MKDAKKIDIVNTKYLYEYSNDEFLEKTYQILLNRAIDDGGKDYYLKKLRKLTKTEIILEIIQSEEFKNLNKDIRLNYLYYLIKFITFKNSNLGVSFDNLAQQYKILRIIRKEIRKLVRKKESLLVRPIHNIDLEYFKRNFSNVAVPENCPVNTTEENPNVYIKELINKLYSIENTIIATQISAKNRPFSKSVYINLTTTRRWRSRTVGIVRTERELAKYLFNNISNAYYVTWIPAKNSFYELPLSYVKNLLNNDWTDPNKTVLTLDDDHLTQKITIQSNDVFISLGLDWDNELTSEIYKLKMASGCKVVLGCHDLIPILYPEYTAQEYFPQLFKKHFIDMFYTADLVWTNSQNSKRDLINFWRQSEILSDKVPSIKVVHLGSDIVDTSINSNEYIEDEVIKNLLIDHPFILYVSSIESRKNHSLLFNLWRENYAIYNEKWPTLVIVGRQGWGVDDLLNQMQRMLAYKNGKIIWLENVSDEILDVLYREAIFSVFPSIYEGWGLGACESLNLGKPCIVADNSSLLEATQGLMPAANPYDFLQWKALLEKMIFDVDYRNSLSDSIATDFQSRTWKDFSKDLLEEVSHFYKKQD